MDAKSKLNELKRKVESIQEQRIRKEEQLNSLKSQRDNILTQLRELGIKDPKTLRSTIQQLEEEINTELTSIEDQIPDDCKI